MYFLVTLQLRFPVMPVSPMTTAVARTQRFSTRGCVVQALGMCGSDLEKRVRLGCVIACLGGTWRGGHSAEGLLGFTNQNVKTKEPPQKWLIKQTGESSVLSRDKSPPKML